MQVLRTKEVARRRAARVVGGAIATLLVAATLVLQTGVLPAQAAGNCGVSSYAYAGYRVQDNNFALVGAKADIETNPQTLCTQHDTTIDSYSSAWLLVFGGWDGDGDGYSQAGYMKKEDWSQHYFFGEWDIDLVGGWSRYVDTTHTMSPNTTYEYQTVYIPALYCGCLANYADGNLLNYTNFDPVNEWSGAFEGQFMGETHRVGDDIVGTAADKTDYGDMEVQNLYTGFANNTLTLNNPASQHPRATQSNSSTSEAKIWTWDP